MQFAQIIHRQICTKLLEMIKGCTIADLERRKNRVNKVLNAPIHMGSMNSSLDDQIDDVKSIWISTRDDGSVSLSI